MHQNFATTNSTVTNNKSIDSGVVKQALLFKKFHLYTVCLLNNPDMPSWLKFIKFLPSKQGSKEIPHSNVSLSEDFQSVRLNLNFDMVSLDLADELESIKLNNDNTNQGNKTSIELSPFESIHTKPSVFVKLKQYIVSKHKKATSNETNIQDSYSKFFDSNLIQYSPESIRLAVRGPPENELIIGNLFLGDAITLDEIIEQNNQKIEEAMKNHDQFNTIKLGPTWQKMNHNLQSTNDFSNFYTPEKLGKIQFKADNDVLIYQQDNDPHNSPESTSINDSDNSPISSSSINGWKKFSSSPQLRRRLSVGSLKPSLSKRILSGTQTLPLQLNKNLNKVDNSTHSILKSKYNSNFETEAANTKKQDSVQIDYFMKIFEQKMFEKTINESNVNKLRLKQLQDYYQLLESSACT